MRPSKSRSIRPERILRPTLAAELNSCSSPDAILTVLEEKANELNQSQSGDERLTKWLTPTVNVLNALSAALGPGVGTVSPNTFAFAFAAPLCRH